MEKKLVKRKSKLVNIHSVVTYKWVYNCWVISKPFFMNITWRKNTCVSASSSWVIRHCVYINKIKLYRSLFALACFFAHHIIEFNVVMVKPYCFHLGSHLVKLKSNGRYLLKSQLCKVVSICEVKVKGFHDYEHCGDTSSI